MLFNIIFGIILWICRDLMNPIAFNLCWWFNIVSGIGWAVFVGIKAYKFYKD